MDAEEHARCRELLGPYVLGHLRPDEVGEVEAHLAICQACADDAADIAPLARTLPERGSEPVPGPSLDDFEEQVVTLAHRRRRRPRQVAAAASLVVVLGAAIIAPELRSEPDQGLGIREVAAAVTSDPRLEVTEAAVMPHTWGTEVFLTVDGLEEDVVYEVVLTTSDGEEVSAGTLLGDAARPVRCVMNGARLREDVTAFELRRVDDGRAVVDADLRIYDPTEV